MGGETMANMNDLTNLNAIFLFMFFLKESRFKGKDFILRKSEIQNYIGELKQQFLKQNTENE